MEPDCWTRPQNNQCLLVTTVPGALRCVQIRGIQHHSNSLKVTIIMHSKMEDINVNCTSSYLVDLLFFLISPDHPYPNSLFSYTRSPILANSLQLHRKSGISRNSCNISQKTQDIFVWPLMLFMLASCQSLASNVVLFGLLLISGL